MAKNFRQLQEQIRADPVRRARIEQYERAIRDALALGELRESRKVTQTAVAGALEVSQANVSRIEHEEDLYLSTLRNYVAALGGRLEIRAVFPDDVITLDVPCRALNGTEAQS